MKKDAIKQLIDVATARGEPDLVIKSAQIVDVFSGKILEGDVAIIDGRIAGIGSYSGKKTFDAKGAFLLPGFIDGHVHIESSYTDPPSFARLLLPCGTTTVIADPHEICNVSGLDGFDYMVESSLSLPLSIFFMLPSCVPSSPFENSGAVLLADSLAKRMDLPQVLGLGEMMDMEGTIGADPAVVDKLALAKKWRKLIDGHAPGVHGHNLNAYAAAGIHTDHECTTPSELQERIERGMYVLLREGSATRDLLNLLPGVTPANAHMCLFCTDDRQPQSILEEGHIDNHLRLAVDFGLDPIIAIRMATLHAANCYGLHDRGAIAPGRRADLVLVNNLKEFAVQNVFVAGQLYKEEQSFKPTPIPSKVATKIVLDDFHRDRFKLRLTSPQVRVIEIIAGAVVTNMAKKEVLLDNKGYYRHDPSQDILKLAVVERHKGTGNVALALITGYGLKHGAVATTIAHDAHNIIVAGDNDADMATAVESLVTLGGGIVMVRDGELLDSLALPIAGLMTNKGGLYVNEKLKNMHQIALEELGIPENIDPFMTLSFMALPVIPHLKVTDMGLFDVDSFSFVSLEL